VLLILFGLLLPIAPVFAQTRGGACTASFANIGQMLTYFTCMIGKLLVPTLFVAALGLFIFGVFTYFINADNAEKRRDGSKFMLWGIVALFVMISVWALVGVIVNTFGLDYRTDPSTRTQSLIR
jgi:hypothetical protein